jgi:hypothetical protein
VTPSGEVTIVEPNPPLDAPTATNFVPFQATLRPYPVPKGDMFVPDIDPHAALHVSPLSVEITIVEPNPPLDAPTATNVVPLQATPFPAPLPKGDVFVPDIDAHAALQLVPLVEVTIEESNPPV